VPRERNVARENVENDNESEEEVKEEATAARNIEEKGAAVLCARMCASCARVLREATS